MLHKLRRQTNRYKLTTSNQLPDQHARHYLINRFRRLRADHLSSAPVRATLGLIQWMLQKRYANEERIGMQTGCFLTGRSRGTTQRFSVARTRVKHLSSKGQLFGVRKSSW